jgi:hypothetical protein
METNESRQRWLAVFPPLAVGLLAIGQALTPSGLDRPITSVQRATSELSIAAAHSGRLYFSNLLVIMGIAALGVSFAAIATLVKGRGSTVASVAAVVGGVACFCGVVVNVVIGLDLAGAATADTTREAAARVLVSTNTGLVATSLLVVYLGGVALAVMLTGVALWRGRAVQRWVAAAFPLGAVLGASSPPGGIAVVMHAPFAVVMVILAVRIWGSAVAVPVTGGPGEQSQSLAVA